MATQSSPIGDDEKVDPRLRQRRILWALRLTSLWAPVVVFLIAFIPYVTWTQLRLQDAAWLLPALRVFGLLMVAYYLALLGARRALPHFRRLRQLRVEALEVCTYMRRRELERLERSSRGSQQKLAELVGAVEAAWLGGRLEQLERSLDKLVEWAEKALPGWRRRSAWDGARGLVLTLLAILLLRTVVAEPYRIPSGSMLPTLQVGDHVIVNRFLYGVRIPFVNVVPFPIVRRPARGDVIVFNNPLDTSKDFIKRVMGVPGDTVVIVNGEVRINGVPQPRQLVAERVVNWDKDLQTDEWVTQEAVLYEESVDGVSHAVLQAPGRSYGREAEGPWTVPPGHVFVLGDNRDRSADSRYGFGVVPGVAFVPYGHIKGKAMVVWLSLAHGGLLSGLFGGTGLGTGRLFLPVR